MKLSQLRDLVRVRAVTVLAWNLENRGQALEARVGQEDPELVAEDALADVRVAVAVRAQLRLGVVHVQGA
jgi:hypothetical protein